MALSVIFIELQISVELQNVELVQKTTTLYEYVTYCDDVLWTLPGNSKSVVVSYQGVQGLFKASWHSSLCRGWEGEGGAARAAVGKDHK